MKLMEKLSLVRAGFKASEIREMEKEETETETDETVTETETETKETETETDETETETESDQEEIDYKKLYEDSQKALSKAQENNRKENIKMEDNTDKTLKDIVSSFI